MNELILEGPRKALLRGNIVIKLIFSAMGSSFELSPLFVPSIYFCFAPIGRMDPAQAPNLWETCFATIVTFGPYF
jgi:hypothetical protein